MCQVLLEDSGLFNTRFSSSSPAIDQTALDAERVVFSSCYQSVTDPLFYRNPCCSPLYVGSNSHGNVYKSLGVLRGAWEVIKDY